MYLLGAENRHTWTPKATGYSARLIKKPDQCRAVYACSYLFWVYDLDGVKDGERVLLCLKRALRIANAAQQLVKVARGSSGFILFVEMLNKHLYFSRKEPRRSQVQQSKVIELVTTEMMQSDSTTSDPSANAFFAVH